MKPTQFNLGQEVLRATEAWLASNTVGVPESIRPHVHLTSLHPDALPTETVMDKNVTDLADFQENDGEYLPLKRCPCGAEFQPWSVVLSIYRNFPRECPRCNRKLYFTSAIIVWEVVNPQDNEGAK